MCIRDRFYEAYGQTESAGASFATLTEDAMATSVGGPLVNTEFKLIDIPEMNYLSSDKDEQGRPTPRGEICLRGPGVIQGYYKDDEKTKEAIDNEGWLHTGDIGVILPNGALRIIDRKKNIFKLQHGEYVAPEKIENVYATSPLVGESFVHGDSLQAYLVGVIFPNEKALVKLAQDNGIEGDFNTLCQNPKVAQLVAKELEKHGRKNKLVGFENIKQVYLSPVALSALGLMTPSFKLKRHDAKKHFIKEIENLYKLPLEGSK
eukprot:TRINITY_DN1407_c0_g1_i4.p1 TRINITY_DN1407_c0_g1~~TRINITY_DN1407_c0_g1_i4.p1  ORF type:complete len:282 (+),score=103.74 TRINITY_DN1407_c0_g1_i4:62-847(+)